MPGRHLTGLAIAVAVTLAGPAVAQEQDRLSLSVGGFDVLDRHDAQTVEGRIEYHSGVRFLSMGASFKGIGPVLGLMANGDGGVFGYGGAFLDLRLGEHMVLWPSAGVGGYSQGDSVDLGGVLEFHTGVTLAYEFENDSHVGVTFTHISNAHLHDRNPGVESLMLTYALPIGRAF